MLLWVRATEDWEEPILFAELCCSGPPVEEGEGEGGEEGVAAADRGGSQGEIDAAEADGGGLRPAVRPAAVES